jgi:ElaB/YqjD/DUF883 family membrane-anchored ribosome-binding protein
MAKAKKAKAKTKAKPSPKETMREVRQEADEAWSGWRGFLRRNPLTGSWISMGVGAVIGAFAIWIM